MAVRNALKGGTDFTEEGLRPTTDLVPTFNAFYAKDYSDNTGGSVTNSASETTIATITIPTADWDSGATSVSFLINTSARAHCDSASTRTCTFNLKVNGSTVDTATTEGLSNGSGTAKSESIGFHYLATGNDLSSSNIVVLLSATWSAADTNATATCQGMTITARYNNN